MSALLWGNPLAWLGIAAVAVPILVHLLAASRARRLPFPTLRFVPASVPAAMRAHRIEDPWLLLLRCLIVAVAVAALTQPWLALQGREGADALARAVVVDTSASMSRTATGGDPAIAAARAAAAQQRDGAGPATIIEAADLAGGIAAARAWLAATVAAGGAAEVVVISDFQRTALRRADLEVLPASVGIRLQRVDVPAPTTVQMPLLIAGDRAWSAAVDVSGDGSAVRWQSTALAVAADPGIEAAAGAGDAAAARATIAAAARHVAVPRDAAARPVTLVWPDAPQRDALLAGARPPDEPWMADVLASLPAGRFTAASDAGRLLLFVDAAPGTVEAAGLVAAARRSGSDIAALDELEPAAIDDATLRAWERAPSAAPAAAGSDGRWLWLMVIALLLAEQLLRRGRGGSGAAAAVDGAAESGDVG